LVRSLGADHVIDYTKEDFTRTGQCYDLIFDAVGNRSVFALRRALKPQGVCVMAGFSGMGRLLAGAVLGPLVSKMGSRKIRFMGLAKPNQKDLLVAKELLEAGKIKPVIDKCYPLTQTADAIRYLEQGHARGKVIIQVIPTPGV
jgi:NADPH:quinone reductase-like Zn-dependent oxidoreductase